MLLLGYYHGFATAATNILFGNIFGVSGSQLLVLVLLVLSLAITPGAAAQRLSANPRRVAVLSVLFAVVAADGGLIASFEATNVKASAFITSISSATYSWRASSGRLSGRSTVTTMTARRARASGASRQTYRTPR